MQQLATVPQVTVYDKPGLSETARFSDLLIFITHTPGSGAQPQRYSQRVRVPKAIANPDFCLTLPRYQNFQAYKSRDHISCAIFPLPASLHPKWAVPQAVGDAPLRSHCSLWALEGHGLDDYQSAFLQGSTRIPTFRERLPTHVEEICTVYLKVLENRKKSLCVVPSERILSETCGAVLS